MTANTPDAVSEALFVQVDSGIGPADIDPVAAEKRFWSRMEWKGDCLEWTGSKNEKGYGAGHLPHLPSVQQPNAKEASSPARRHGERQVTDPRTLARAVESAIFQCLMNAGTQPEREDYWRRKADTFERKFTTDYGRHYSHFLGAAK